MCLSIFMYSSEVLEMDKLPQEILPCGLACREFHHIRLDIGKTMF